MAEELYVYSEYSTWSTTTPTTSSPASRQTAISSETSLGPFAKLPFELRAQIWQHLTPSRNLFLYCAKRKRFFPTTAVSESWNWLALTRTCRQIHAEVSEIVYQRLPLRLRIHPFFGRGSWDEKPTKERDAKRAYNGRCRYFDAGFLARFRKLRVEVWAAYQWAWEEDVVPDRISNGVVDVAAMLAESERLPAIEVVVWHYDGFELLNDCMVRSEDDIRMLMRPILLLAEDCSPVEVRYACAVKTPIEVA